VILAYVFVFLILVALLAGRDLGALGKVSYRGGWKLAAVVASLFVLQVLTVIYVPGQNVLQITLLILSQVALILVFLLNRHVPGARLFALGIILNTTVMVANGGWMPVTPDTDRFVHPERIIASETRPAASKNIVLLRTDTKLWILSDIIRVSLPWRRYAVSVGDLLLIVGAAQFIFQTTSAKRENALGDPSDLTESPQHTRHR
jgi:hypothetical protein